MKIQLSEDEIYEIKLPEQIGIEEFSAIVTKFNFLHKNFTKFNIGDNPNSTNSGIILNKNETKDYKKQDRSKWLFLRNNREAVVNILKAYYLGEVEEFEKVVKSYGINLDRGGVSSITMRAIREIHNIKPEEVGLKAFPTQNLNIKSQRLDNQN